MINQPHTTEDQSLDEGERRVNEKCDEIVVLYMDSTRQTRLLPVYSF